MELLITIAVMAVLAALAVMSYSRVLHAAQSSEARQVLGQIKSGEEAYRAEMLQYLSVSTSMTDYYPNTTPNDTKWAWAQPSDTRYYQNPPPSGWQLLNVNPDGPVRYGYVVMASTTTKAPALDASFKTPPAIGQPSSGMPWFVAGARNEHISTSAPPSLAVTTSYDGEIYWEGEGE